MKYDTRHLKLENDKVHLWSHDSDVWIFYTYLYGRTEEEFLEDEYKDMCKIDRSKISDMNRGDLEAKFKEILYLIIQCRDALPAISITAARLHGIDLTLADRIDTCLIPFKVEEDNPNGI